MKTGELVFGQFRLDRANALLWRGQERVFLAPKPFEVLCCLVERPGELVTKEELLDAVWTDLHVSESSLTVAMNTVRAALGDDRWAPRFIETVTRRGYRFIASVAEVCSGEQPPEEEASVADGAGDQRRHWPVGRSAPLTLLEGVLQKAFAGRRQVVFVTGEAGIGKTTFVQMATQRMKQRGVGVLHCVCNELFGAHEAFLPLIEALHQLCRGPAGAPVPGSLRNYAPTWLAQMSWVLVEDDRAAFQHEVFGATRERMLREFCDLMKSMAARQPWLIILEDLHCSDAATVDALSRLARRDRNAAIIVLATYRPTDASAGGHPIRNVHQDLQIHGHCTELALDPLSRAEVEQHLALRFTSSDLAERLTERVFTRTGGQPLFVVSLVDHLIAQGVIVNIDGEWRLAPDEAESQDNIPRDLREMITRQIDRLTADERGLLEVASAAGVTFSALLLAGALDRDVLEVEQICEELARSGRLVASAGVSEWPNEAVSGSYVFVHALYREVLYERLAPARRVNTHRRVGESLERGYGPRASEVASALALHFELGRDFPKAVRYLGLAAESSARRFGAREAASYLTRAINLVPQLPAEAEASTRLKILLQRAWVWRAAGDFVRALGDLAAMVAHGRETGHLRDEINGLVNLSRFHLYVDRRQCLPFAEQAVERSRAMDDAAIRAFARGNLANLNLMLRGWRTEDAHSCHQAAMLIDESQDFSARMRRCSMDMVLHFLSSDYTACCDATIKGRELTRMVGDVYLFVIFNTVEAFARLYLGEWGKVRQMAGSALAISKRNVNVQASVLCRLTIAWLHCEAQEFECAAKQVEETLNPAVEANPFNFFIGRVLLAKIYLGQGNLPLARQQLEVLERKIEFDGVAMESTVIQHYFLSRCDYWFESGNMEQAQKEAARLQEITATAPDRQFLSYAHEAMARIAMVRGDSRAAASHLRQAISIVRNARLPLAAWRIYATAARFFESHGDAGRAARFRKRSEEIVNSLANSLEPDDPLRSAALFTRGRAAGD
ncbi:AAA family ATPase [Rhodoblastus acidophilus]|uniref:ATP-binding protein n=1 Tax=Candidatus Rhodoblastus alkanivorans TaxID=2954117 RepID=UPI001FAB069E|nr:AAA family ATPase [Candidatus Rhodoblastus alkanivorans]MCI4680784.1 AAA family ATPase [Candidatus Rhodoblastus alkanivorans]MDI4642368.1 AAA family ATPase [Rhodoblastus acidophilus]